LLTTSREPSPRTRSLIKDLASLSANVIRANRGKMTVKELMAAAIARGAKTLAIVGEMRGNPSIIRIYDIEPLLMGLKPLHAFTVFIEGVSLSRERQHAMPDSPANSACVVSDEFVSESHRNLALSLSRFFSAPVVARRAARDPLHVYATPRGNRYIVHFKYLGKPVGPVLKVSEARIIGREVEVG